MSLLEWFGEQHDPGGRGKIQFGEQYRAERAKKIVLLKFAIAVVFLVMGTGAGCFVVSVLPLPAFQGSLLVLGLAMIYVSVAYFVHPEPDESNMGWLGGMFDNPIRYSDDINRSLMGLDMLLAPGRYVAEGLVDFATYLRADDQPHQANTLMQAPVAGDDRDVISVEQDTSFTELGSAPIYGQGIEQVADTTLPS